MVTGYNRLLVPVRWIKIMTLKNWFLFLVSAQCTTNCCTFPTVYTKLGWFQQYNSNPSSSAEYVYVSYSSSGSIDYTTVGGFGGAPTGKTYGGKDLVGRIHLLFLLLFYYFFKTWRWDFIRCLNFIWNFNLIQLQFNSKCKVL